jgi:hypothetical protein
MQAGGRTTRRMAWVFTFLLVVGMSACDGDDDEAGDADAGQQVATLDLEDAFSATADASRYRITESIGQMISSPALGMDTDAPLDEENPMTVGEVTPDVSHLRMELSALLGPVLGDDAPSVSFEIWTGPDRMVVDTRGYAVLAEQNPSADLGPFEPGVSFVDLEAVGDEYPDLLAALVGGLPDLGELADRLPEALEGVEQSGRSFTGTASYTDLVEAMGSDPKFNARSAAAGLALSMDLDPDVLTDFYVEFYEGIHANITVDVGTDGTVRALRYDANLSGLFPAMVDHRDELGLDIPADQLDEVREAFAETVWTLEALIRFEVVDDLQVAPAPATTDDRTEEWLTFLRNGGF